MKNKRERLEQSPALRIIATIPTREGPMKLRLDGWNTKPTGITDPVYVLTIGDSGQPEAQG